MIVENTGQPNLKISPRRFFEMFLYISNNELCRTVNWRVYGTRPNLPLNSVASEIFYFILS